jgi:hypothetical protein
VTFEKSNNVIGELIFSSEGDFMSIFELGTGKTKLVGSKFEVNPRGLFVRYSLGKAVDAFSEMTALLMKP